MSEFITVDEACRVIGGNERPIHYSTYYRGVSAGRYPAPVHPTILGRRMTAR